MHTQYIDTNRHTHTQATKVRQSRNAHIYSTLLRLADIAQ